MKTIPTLEELLKAGVHFGHRTSRWHPKMGPYIFGVRSGIHIIDIAQTQKYLQEAGEYIKTVVGRGGTILFVGTKNQITDAVEKSAKACSMPYINNRWLGGTFTNFTEIQKLIREYLDLQDKRSKGDLKKYTKLEQLQFDRKIDELDEKIGGISTLTRLPDAIFVFDVRTEKTAIAEARKRGVKVIAICDTNVNPTDIDYVIPANDDSIRGTELIGKVIAEMVNEGKKLVGKSADQSKAPAKKVQKEEEVDVTSASKETVEDLDDEIKEKLAKEREETLKK